MNEPEGRGAAWTEERATKERATREGGASRAPRRRAGRMSEPEGRGAAWTEERATKERATREGGASRAPRRRAGEHSEPEGRGAAWTAERATKERATREGAAVKGEGEAGGAPLAGRVMLEATADLAYDAVGGLTLGADPVAAAMMHAAAAQGRHLDAFVV